MKTKNNRGVALLLVLMVLALLSVLAIEIIFASRVDLRIAKNARDRVQAIYLAQSGARLGMLRLHMYGAVKNLGSAASAVIPETTQDQIWSMPFPSYPFPNSKIDWPGTVSATIESESSKIPINLLDGNWHRGSSPEIAADLRNEIKAFIEGLMEDEEFEEKYHDLEADDLLDPLVDWIDADSDRQGGGNENNEYERFDPPYGARNDRIPDLSELHLIQGWTDDLYNRIAATNFTVIGNSREANPNFISLDRIKAMDKTLEPEDLLAIQRRRLETPFKDLADLANFIRTNPDIRGGKSFNFEDNLKDVKQENVFTISASGIVGEARRTVSVGLRFALERKTKAAKNASTKYGKMEVVFVKEVL